MSKYLSIFLLLLCFLLSQTSFAQDIVTDRPDLTESPVSVPIGSFQVETGMMIEMDDFERNWVLNTTLFRYGVVKDLEFRLVTELINTKPIDFEKGQTGVADLQFGLKYQFMQGNTEMAYLGHLVMPTGNRNVSADHIGMCHKLSIGHTLSDRISLGYNLGLEYFNSDDYAGIYTLAVGIGLTDRIGFFAEVYGDWVLFDSVDVLYDNGFTWLIKPNLQLDFSVGTGISSKSNFYSVGISWLVPSSG